MRLVRQFIKMKEEQEAFERVNYYEFQKEIFKAEHVELLKNKGELLVGCFASENIYKLSYDKQTQSTQIEQFRSGLSSTAALAGWHTNSLITYLCNGIVYEQDLLIAKRRPELEIIALEKAHKKELLKKDIQAGFAILGLITMIVLPFILNYLQKKP